MQASSPFSYLQSIPTQKESVLLLSCTRYTLLPEDALQYDIVQNMRNLGPNDDGRGGYNAPQA